MKLIRGALLAVVAWGVSPVAQAKEQQESVISIGEVAGGLNFYSGGLADITDVGPSWAVRLNADLRWLGGELGYVGAYNHIADSPLLGDNPGSIWKNGVATLAKVGPLIDRVRPYAGAGVGVSFLHPTQNATPQFRDDFVFEIPLTLGIDYRAERITAGVRGSWTPLVGLEVADGGVFSDTNGGSFLTTLNVGGVF